MHSILLDEFVKRTSDSRLWPWYRASDCTECKRRPKPHSPASASKVFSGKKRKPLLGIATPFFFQLFKAHAAQCALSVGKRTLGQLEVSFYSSVNPLHPQKVKSWREKKTPHSPMDPSEAWSWFTQTPKGHTWRQLKRLSFYILLPSVFSATDHKKNVQH